MSFLGPRSHNLGFENFWDLQNTNPFRSHDENNHSRLTTVQRKVIQEKWLEILFCCDLNLCGADKYESLTDNLFLGSAVGHIQPEKQKGVNFSLIKSFETQMEKL